MTERTRVTTRNSERYQPAVNAIRDALRERWGWGNSGSSEAVAKIAYDAAVEAGMYFHGDIIDNYIEGLEEQIDGLRTENEELHTLVDEAWTVLSEWKKGREDWGRMIRLWERIGASTAREEASHA